MNFAAVWQWMQQKFIVFSIVLFLIWKDLLAILQVFYGTRQERLTQRSNNTVRLAEIGLDEKRLEGLKGEGGRPK